MTQGLTAFTDATITGPPHRMSKKILRKHARNLLNVAGAVSQRLGYQPPRARRA